MKIPDTQFDVGERVWVVWSYNTQRRIKGGCPRCVGYGYLYRKCTSSEKHAMNLLDLGIHLVICDVCAGTGERVEYYRKWGVEPAVITAINISHDSANKDKELRLSYHYFTSMGNNPEDMFKTRQEARAVCAERNKHKKKKR